MKVSECIFFQMARATKMAGQFINEKVKHLNLTGVQAMVISCLIDEDQIPPGVLGERIQLTSATLTGLIDRIEKIGLLERKPHPSDRRAVLVCLTEKGQKIGVKVKEIIEESNDSYLSSISHEEGVFLRGILSKLAN